jgi:hypothetical protein
VKTLFYKCILTGYHLVDVQGIHELVCHLKIDPTETGGSHSSAISVHCSADRKKREVSITKGFYHCAWSTNLKIVWYVLLRPLRPELDCQDQVQIIVTRRMLRYARRSAFSKKKFKKKFKFFFKKLLKN